jgi:phosphate transport system substrate-binding protein
MKTNFKYTVILAGLALLLAASCTGYSDKQINKETPTRGDIKIGVDEGYKLLIDAEIEVFKNLYKYAEITPINASEDSIVKLFMADSIRTMITSRKLTSNEEAFLKEKLIIARTTPIAWDAVAFVVNKQNPNSELRYGSIQDIFEGKAKTWKQIDNRSRLGNMEVVFDNQGSSNVRYIMNKFNITTLPEYCYSANSNPAVIDYVENHPNSIGIISVNWISDPDDSITHNFLNRVKVVGVTQEAEGDDYYTPHPAYIAQKTYPFIRQVYAITRETTTGLGRGFIKFVAYDSGQRIVLKMGMLPATMPIRLIQTRSE